MPGEQKAKSVLDWLITKAGVDAKRLAPGGFGDIKPIACNKTAKGKALNRRVVLVPKSY